MDLKKMMEQAQEMQAKMAEMQTRLAELEIEGQSGGGMVTVVMTGKNEMRSIRIDPSLLKADEGDMLEDLIVAAVNDARAKAEARVQEETGRLMGGLNLPPDIKLPF